jgi:hypothetical protein
MAWDCKCGCERDGHVEVGTATFYNRMVVLTGVLARLCYGFRRIWRMIIHITLHSDIEEENTCAHFTGTRVGMQYMYMYESPMQRL